MLSEISQMQEEKRYMIPLTCGIEKSGLCRSRGQNGCFLGSDAGHEEMLQSRRRVIERPKAQHRNC